MPGEVKTAATLEQIVKETVKTLEQSQEAIYNIAETARQEETRLRQELDEVRLEFSAAAARVDKLEVEEKRARKYLMEVSRDFSRHGEKEMQAAYERAREYQVQLGLWRERLKLLGGKLTIKTAPGQGTELEMVIPRQQGWSGDLAG